MNRVATFALSSTFCLKDREMKLVPLALAATLAIGMAWPAAAQTVQTSPGKPASPAITTPPGTTTPAPGSKPTAAPATGSSSSTLVDINSASAADLDALPGIGKARADAIIKNRPYNGKDDLVNRGILPANIYKGISSKIIARRS